MWKTMLAPLFLGGALFLFPGVGRCGQEDGAAAYTKLSAQQAKAVMESGEPYVLLDVRTEGEFQERHIQGAVLIPDTEIKTRAASELLDKNVHILVYCRSGRKSANVAGELAGMGYVHVYDFGGINDWPYETVTGPDAATR